MSEESNSTENKDTKNPMSVFFKLTVVSLVFTASVMFLFYNFAKFKNVDVGSLGGAFQGTFGVAAAVAGAIVTIQLAKIAIDQGNETNKIAERQARNDAPDYLLAREVKVAFTTIRSSHTIIKSMYDAAHRLERTAIISKNALERLTEALTSNPIYQVIELHSVETKKMQCITDIGNLIFTIEQMLNEKEESHCSFKDEYTSNTKAAFISLNEAIKMAVTIPDNSNDIELIFPDYLREIIVFSKDKLPIE